jgi:hypothetical protein
MRWVIVVVSAAGLMLQAGCAGTITEGDCHSHYEHVADAPTKPALRRQLLHDVDPRVRSLRVIDSDRPHDKVVVNLLNGRRHVVMSLDMWRRDNGTWTAQRWSQCID